ncbi:globin-2 B chain-like isoform X2 [Pecten maximus]|nr:globin-2 B chain-like isoform X2 [Pecten maximus]
MASNGQSKNGCSEGPITEEDVEMLKRSWEVLGGDKKTNGVKFFMKLFTMHPSAKDYFADFKGVPLKDMEYNGETTKANRRMVAHATRVMYSLESYIDSLDDLECLKELVRKIAITHKPRNIKAPQFALLTDVLHAVIDDLVGEQSDDVKKMKSAWTKLMEQVCKIVEEEQRDK